MRKFFQLGWLLFIVMGLAVCACSDEKMPGEDANTENNGGGSNGEGGSDVPTAIKPSMDEESLKFVGGWEGMGPYQASGTSSFGLVDGCWTFYNDGTYTWLGSNSYGFTTEMEGKWHYNAEKKMLITDSELGFNWTIEEVSGDMWVGTLLNAKGGTYTYRRKEIPSVACSNVRVIDYKKGGFVLKDTVLNYGSYAGTLKCGVCYSLAGEAKEVADYQKVYATEIVTDTVVHVGTIAESSATYRGVYLVELKSLEQEGKYNLCNFIEFEDGSIIYGNIYRAKCVTLPDGAVYLGQQVGTDHKIYCWAKGYLREDGTFNDGVAKVGDMGAMFTWEKAETMLASLGDGWVLPTSAELYSLKSFVEGNNTIIQVTPNEFNSYNTYDDVTFKSQINGKTLNFTFESEDYKDRWYYTYTRQNFRISEFESHLGTFNEGGFKFEIFSENNSYFPSRMDAEFIRSPKGISSYLRPVYVATVTW